MLKNEPLHHAAINKLDGLYLLGVATHIDNLFKASFLKGSYDGVSVGEKLFCFIFISNLLNELDDKVLA